MAENGQTRVTSLRLEGNSVGFCDVGLLAATALPVFKGFHHRPRSVQYAVQCTLIVCPDIVIDVIDSLQWKRRDRYIDIWIEHAAAVTTASFSLYAFLNMYGCCMGW